METINSWISALVISVLGGGCIVLWSTILYRQHVGESHFFSPQQRLRLPIGLIDLFLAVFLWIMGQTVGITIAVAIVGGGFDPNKMTLYQQTVVGYSVGLSVLVTTILTLVYLYGRYQRLETFGLGGGLSRMGRDIGLGAVVFLCFVPITFLVQAVVTQLWPYEHPTLELISPESSLLTILSAWWMAVIVAPISEEFFFRGMLQGWLSRLFMPNRSAELPLTGGWPARHPNAQVDPALAGANANSDSQPMPSKSHRGNVDNPYLSPETLDPAVLSDSSSPWYVASTWAPVVITAFLFGMVHFGQGPAPIPIFVFGLGLGLIYRQTGRIVPCIIAHFMLNSFSMVAFSIERLYFPETTPESQEAIDLVPAMVGVIWHGLVG